MKTIRGYAVRANQTGPITFLASTNTLARDGMIIESSAWDLRSYRDNPVVLYSHDYVSRPPIGRATRLEVTDSGLVADLEFDQDDPFAVEIERKIRTGFINTVSVGWDTHESLGNRVKKAELLDISVVSVPGDAGALALARSAYKSVRGSTSPITVSQLRSLSHTDLEKLHKVICGPSQSRKSGAFDELAELWPSLSERQKSRFVSNLITFRRKVA